MHSSFHGNWLWKQFFIWQQDKDEVLRKTLHQTFASGFLFVCVCVCAHMSVQLEDFQSYSKIFDKMHKVSARSVNIKWNITTSIKHKLLNINHDTHKEQHTAPFSHHHPHALYLDTTIHKYCTLMREKWHEATTKHSQKTQKSWKKSVRVSKSAVMTQTSNANTTVNSASFQVTFLPEHKCHSTHKQTTHG